MIKLTNILTELLNTFEITAIIISDKKEPITDILENINEETLNKMLYELVVYQVPHLPIYHYSILL